MEGKKPKVSVIVPVYKVENILHHCIDSILAQTIKEIELILVDDGSPDGCGAICDEYAHKESRVKVIHKTNGGVSSARNAGMDVAQGTWICFVDSDDWIDETYLQDFLKNENDSELIMQGYRKIHNGEVLSESGFFGFESKSFEEILAYSEIHHIINSPCFKLYKRDVINSNNIRFDTNVSYGEDHLFSLSYVNHINSISYSNTVGYNYLVTDSESLTKRRIPYKQIVYYIHEAERLSDLLLEKYDSRLLKGAFDETFIDNVSRAIRYFFRFNTSYKEYCDMIGSFALSRHIQKGMGLKRRVTMISLRYAPRIFAYALFLFLNKVKLL